LVKIGLCIEVELVELVSYFTWPLLYAILFANTVMQEVTLGMQLISVSIHLPNHRCHNV